MTDRNFCHFGPNWKIKILTLKKNTWRYYHFTHLNHKWQSHDVWFLRYGARQTQVFVILDHFLPIYPPMKKTQNLEKKEKTPEYIIILKMRTINDSYMMYGFWETERDRQNFLSFWTIFWPFIPLTTTKNQNFEKIKKHLEILSFYTCVP